jgi:Icc-related predicted phosphoesterase
VIRVAGVGDIHVAADSAEDWRTRLARVNADADVLLLAGDLTRHGSREEAAALARALSGVEIPLFAVLGNHDYHADLEDVVIAAVESRGGRVLEGDAAELRLDSASVGIAGTTGFGGGFLGACTTDFGERETKEYIGTTRRMAERLRVALDELETDYRIALLHYAPITATLQGERLEIFPFLGSYLLAEAVDAAGAHLVLHGHAHMGREKGETSAGVCVRNVAEPVIRSAYRVYLLGHGSGACVPGTEAAESA